MLVNDSETSVTAQLQLSSITGLADTLRTVTYTSIDDRERIDLTSGSGGMLIPDAGQVESWIRSRITETSQKTASNTNVTLAPWSVAVVVIE